MKKDALVVAAAVAVTSLSAHAADLYVSLETGDNNSLGTKDAPLKNLWRALERSTDGDTIHLAEGVYPGKMNQNWFFIDKAVSIVGGYSKDFAERKPLEHRTMFQALNENNDKKGGWTEGVFSINFSRLAKQPDNVDMKFDGLIFDEGFANSYHETKGKLEGLDTGKWLEGPAWNKGRDKFPSPNRNLVCSTPKNRATGNLSFKNCAFVNSGNSAIFINWYKGKVSVENCVICNNRMVGAQVFCSSEVPMDGPDTPRAERNPEVEWEFAHNTVLFTWSRMDDLADMGYGLRVAQGVRANIHHNVIGLNLLTGFDSTKGAGKEKFIRLDNNVFFNCESDVQTMVARSVAKVRVNSFGELEKSEGFETIRNNEGLADPTVLTNRINLMYLGNFLVMMQSSKTDRVRNGLGMFCNRYPLEDALKLFGMIPGKGAQDVR